jgi:hypothetical protein
MLVGVTIVPYLSTGDYWHRMAILPGPAKFVPEVLGGVALLCVIALGIRDRFRFVRPAYWVVFALLVISLTAGAVANKLDPGPLFTGIRAYVRAIPWFLMPAVFSFSENQLRTQFKWLLGISLLQVPIAIEQRIQTANDYYGFVAITGDMTIGTLQLSGYLSIFLIGVACVIAALTLKGFLSKWRGLLLAILVLIPTMINETKATVIMLPLGVFATFLAAAPRGQRLKQLVIVPLVLCVFLALFVPVYDALVEGRKDASPIGDFFFKSDTATQYLETNSGIGATKPMGRVDALRIAAEETIHDPVRAAFGVGIGNTMGSTLGPQFSGKYVERYAMVTAGTNLAGMLLELGFFGFALVLWLHWLIIRDAWFVAEHGDNRTSALAAGWVGITAVMLLSLPYTAIQVSVALSFLFWYFSGFIAAERVRLTAVAPVPYSPRVPARLQGAQVGRKAHI